MHDVRDGPVLRHHRIPSAQLAELCAGGGGVETMRTLWAGQRSRRLLLLDTVRRTLDDPADMGPLPPAGAAWPALATAGDDALLLHPQVGSWAAYTLRRKRGRATSDLPFWVDAGILHTLALVASARARRPWRTSVPVRNGTVMLPALGLVHFGGRHGGSVAEAAYADGEIRIRLGGETVVVPQDPARPAEGWWPLRRLRVGDDPVLSVLLDDVDPFRELADPVEPDRLDDASVTRWTQLLDRAWAILRRDHDATARALATGLVSIVPLPADEWGTTRSASTGEAFASVMISPPVDEVDLAVSLVHEFQHVKLGGLLHLLPLTGSDGALHHAPWRDDPRPLAGLVQGVYAFFGIADFWRTRRHVSTGRYRRIADFEFAYARGQVQEALAELRRSRALTEVGAQLVAGLSERLRSWETEPVDAVAASSADVLCAAHRAEWRLRHVRPEAEAVRAVAAAWIEGEPAGPVALRSAIVPAPAGRWSLRWQELARTHLAGRADRTGAAAEDGALLSGDTGRAGAGYRRRIAADPDDLPAWVGLSLAAAPEPLRSRPEWVHAVFHELRAGGENVDPVALCRRLGVLLPSLSRPVGAQDPLDLGEVR